MNAQQRALDDLEDARADFESYRRGLRWTVVALLSSVAAILLGAGDVSSGVSVALCILGGFGIPISLVFGGVWMATHRPERGPTPSQKLRTAERSYRDAVM